MQPPLDSDHVQNIVDILSRPVVVDRYDMLGDEIAAVVSKHTLNWDIEDVNKMVTPFRPVQQAIAAP